MGKPIYVVGMLAEKKEVRIAGWKSELKLTWADGMIGVMPAFDDLEKAEKYAGDKFNITEFEVEDWSASDCQISNLKPTWAQNVEGSASAGAVQTVGRKLHGHPMGGVISNAAVKNGPLMSI